METEANYATVGAFVLGFLILIVVFIIWISQVNFGQKITTYDVYFRGSVTGLKDGSSVRYRGIPVGTVAKIALDPNNVEQVRVTVTINRNVPIKQDTYASLEMQGITGNVYVQLHGGTQAGQPLRRKENEPYPIIASRPSRFEEVVDSVPEMLHLLSVFVEEMRSVFDEDNRQAFRETLKNMSVLTLEFDKSLKEFTGATAAAKAILEENRKSVRDFTGAGLTGLSQFLLDAREMINTFNRIGQSLERSPTRFLFNDPKQGYKVP